MIIVNYKSKKDLKENIGKKLDYTETSMFGLEYKSNGKFSACNRPSINSTLINRGILRAREFFTTITIKDDLIFKVE
tara:strand:+ start:347 stop:577 length:231 start_codon:yes stop_codon:yes gene_type:complete